MYREYTVVLVKPMSVVVQHLFRDAKLSVCTSSNFVVEVAEVSRITAIFPNQITKKCIYFKMGDEIYVFLTAYMAIRDLSGLYKIHFA